MPGVVAGDAEEAAAVVEAGVAEGGHELAARPLPGARPAHARVPAAAPAQRVLVAGRRLDRQRHPMLGAERRAERRGERQRDVADPGPVEAVEALESGAVGAAHVDRVAAAREEVAAARAGLDAGVELLGDRVPVRTGGVHPRHVERGDDSLCERILEAHVRAPPLEVGEVDRVVRVALLEGAQLVARQRQSRAPEFLVDRAGVPAQVPGVEVRRLGAHLPPALRAGGERVELERQRGEAQRVRRRRGPGAADLGAGAARAESGDDEGEHGVADDADLHGGQGIPEPAPDS